MASKSTVYNTQNILSLVAVFLVIFWLLYSIASFLQESRQIREEIEAIRIANESLQEEIEGKKKELEYLQTSQRVEKEAKAQMAKKRPGEKVVVFVPEDSDILPVSPDSPLRPVITDTTPLWEKWWWVFFGDRT